MQRRSNRLSRYRDDEMKHELQSLLRSGHPTRAEEWHDPEPVAEDDPELALGPVPAPGSLGAKAALRFELGRHLGRTAFPSSRDGLLRTLRERNAPERLIDVVRAAPSKGSYRSVQQLVDAFEGREEQE
jgi:hypothetical protein